MATRVQHQADVKVQSVVIAAPGQMAVIDEAPLPALKPGQFRLETLYSGVSAGTELTFFAGTNPKAHYLFDKDYRLFRAAGAGEHLTDEYPVRQDGLEVGRVVESLSDKVPVGTVVSMIYGHKTAHVAHEDDYYITLPDGLDPLLGVYVAKMGPICANGILVAADDLHRDKLVSLQGTLAKQRVAVLGAGVVGMLTALLAKWAGAADVVIVDTIDERLDAAAKLGLAPLKAPANLGKTLKDRWTSDNANDRGADYIFQCTGSDALLAAAFGGLREQGTLVDLGFYQGDTHNVYLGHEFHHNSLRHLCAQIGSIPRHQQPRWNRRQLAMETARFLGEYGDGLKEHFITHVVKFSKAQGVYDAMLRRDPSILQVVLEPDQLAD